MTSTRDEHTVYAFGDYRLDARRRLLLRVPNERLVKLTPKAIELLLVLVEHAGELVTKDALMEAVWPGVVVEENSLSQTVSALRRALREHPRDHRYIATVPGQGYRFVAAVSRVDGDELAATAFPEIRPKRAAAEGASRRPDIGRLRRYARYAVPVALVFVVLAVASLVLRRTAEDTPAASGALRIVHSGLVPKPGGGSAQPTLSPDGSRVAYVSHVDGTPQIFVHHLGRGAPRQLTHEPTGATRPGWSARDDRIVFQTGASGIGFIDTMGTLDARMLIEDGINPSLSWNGEALVYERGIEIRLALADGSRQRVVEGVAGGMRVFASAFPTLSPNGRQIVYFQQSVGPLGDYWMVPSAGGQPRRLTFDLQWGGKAAWTPDGKSVIVPSRRGGTLTLWSVPAGGGEPHPLTTGLGEDRGPVVTRDGRTLLYTNTRVETLFVVTEPETAEHRVVYRSRRGIWFPRVSPDGQRLAFFAEVEPREQLMLMSVDGTGVQQLTEYRSDEANIMPRWSPDGAHIYYYQDMPPASLRRIALRGGPAEQVFGEFGWELNMDAEWSPAGDRVAFARLDPQSGERRVHIRNLASGVEAIMEPAIRTMPRWSEDGRYMLGIGFGKVVICATDGGECRAIADDEGGPRSEENGEAFGPFAEWSWDESRVFYSHPTASPVRMALWVVNRDGSGKRHLFDYGPVFPIDRRFEVLAGDRILWVRHDRADTELVRATLSGTGSSP